MRAEVDFLRSYGWSNLIISLANGSVENFLLRSDQVEIWKAKLRCII